VLSACWWRESQPDFEYPSSAPLLSFAAFFFHPICTLDMASKIRGLKWQGVWFVDDEGDLCLLPVAVIQAPFGAAAAAHQQGQKQWHCRKQLPCHGGRGREAV
jgi:hypothetical protein